MADKPMGVTPLGVIAIVLGVLGLIGCAVGLIALVFSPKSQPPYADPRLSEVNLEFTQRMEGVTKESRRFSKVTLPAILLSSGMMIAAGVLALRLQGLLFVRMAFAFGFLVETLSTVVGLYAQYRTMGVMKWYFHEAIALVKLPTAIETGMQIGNTIGLLMGVGWLGVKGVFYILGFVTFSRRPMRAAFEGKGPEPVPPGVSP